MCRIRLRTANPLPAFTIPLPDELRIVRESFRRRQFRRIQVSPISILPAKSRNPALRRNSSTGDDNHAHKRNDEMILGQAHRLPTFGSKSPLRTADPTTHSHPICRPLFCSSSQLCSGLKYSAMARVEISSPVASFNILRQSSVAPFFRISFSHVPISLLSA